MTFPARNQLNYFFMLFFPLLLTQMAQVGTNVFSSVFSGRAGTVDLAGVAVAVNIWYPVFAGVCGIFFGISPILSQLRGANKTDDIPSYIMQSIYLSLFFTIFIILFGIIFTDPFLRLMSLDPAVYYIAKEYLFALSLGILPTFIQATLRYVVDAHGMTHLSMAVLLTNMVLTIFLFYGLIFGAAGLPALGGAGAGYAITIAAWLTLFLFILIFRFKEPFRSYRLWRVFRPFDWFLCREQLRLGIPIFIAVFCETSLFSIVGLLMSEFGTVFLAANQAATSYSEFIYTIPWSISLTATIVIGYEVGAKNPAGARQYAVICQGVSLFIACLTVMLTYIGLDIISGAFTSDYETFTHIRTFIIYAMLFAFFDALGTPVQGILRGYKDVKVITFVSFITYWLISIPLGIALAHATDWGAYGYWLSLIIGLAINAFLLNARLWHHTAWRA
ncbi:MATE family efflux transporter [Megasphaera vaginalis (ex Srinivasan et al. 2021)]|uniref:Probable multidrug resistance protein NorM n=1 Tax=Megasphaera vaginalis (ex Srinivasan et al. 2021) TaxID=1111454 RepID=U7URS8_9FIRM|nr:MATE family efflux transporter [Megasphaera vaginalis (ex Srinivasan et al. 2021)]ERT62006.1 MATE efflux family protein [Megasphaera vaginalis (ex Srinivasan et al. 2021)]